MKVGEKNCGFVCNYLDNTKECEAIGTECIGDMCENWECCQNCTKSEDCDNLKN